MQEAKGMQHSWQAPAVASNGISSSLLPPQIVIISFNGGHGFSWTHVAPTSFTVQSPHHPHSPIRRSEPLPTCMTWYFKRSYNIGLIMVIILILYMLGMPRLAIAEGKGVFHKNGTVSQTYNRRTSYKGKMFLPANNWFEEMFKQGLGLRGEKCMKSRKVFGGKAAWMELKADCDRPVQLFKRRHWWVPLKSKEKQNIRQKLAGSRFLCETKSF